MLEPLKIHPPIFDRRFDFTSEELSTLEMIGRVAQKANEIMEVINNWQDNVDQRELSSDITVKRKLSPSGNFTGTIAGRLSSLVVADVEDAKDKIVFLAEQFADGQTGLVVDGGYFEGSEIKKSYDGGRF